MCFAVPVPVDVADLGSLLTGVFDADLMMFTRLAVPLPPLMPVARTTPTFASACTPRELAGFP